MPGAEDPQEQVAEFLERIVEALGIDGEVDVVDDGETITGTVHADEVGLLIGHHGQTIDAVQHLAVRIVHGEGPRPSRRVVIDAGDYRERRRATLIRMAEDAADEALADDRPVSLEAMSAAERRIVHEHLRDREDVDTHSEGDEPERYLVVAPRA